MYVSLTVFCAGGVPSVRDVVPEGGGVREKGGGAREGEMLEKVVALDVSSHDGGFSGRAVTAGRLEL